MSDRELPSESASRRIFLLSPANIAGIRGGRLMCDSAESELSSRLRGAGAPLGEVFSFISALYFRGKLAYARRFANAPPTIDGAFVITACGGLITPETMVTRERLREISANNIDLMNHRYRSLLDRDSQALSELAGSDCQIVLLGSVATPKYAEPLLRIFGERLLFPAEFVGRGNMSRGSPFLMGSGWCQAALPAVILCPVEVWISNVRTTGSASSRGCRVSRTLLYCSLW